ncbi:hypothetical protein [Mycolicibacterium frederiksbergense]|nr:hypothetical protein [Mycolicibacterium frederiksbergense]
MISPMTGVGRRGRAGRPSLGDRAVMTARLPLIVQRTVDAAAADHGTDRTAVLTDIVCFHYGRLDLMRHLPQQLLFETSTATTELSEEDRRIGPHVKVRPPRAVANIIDVDVDDLHRGVERSTYLADIICHHTGYPQLVRDTEVQKEGLPLAM